MMSRDRIQQLINKIQTTTDPELLEEVYRILEVGVEDDEKMILSDAQKGSIDAGLKDLHDGNFLSNEDANQDIKKWLQE